MTLTPRGQYLCSGWYASPCYARLGDLFRFEITFERKGTFLTTVTTSTKRVKVLPSSTLADLLQLINYVLDNCGGAHETAALPCSAAVGDKALPCSQTKVQSVDSHLLF